MKEHKPEPSQDTRPVKSSDKACYRQPMGGAEPVQLAAEAGRGQRGGAARTPKLDAKLVTVASADACPRTASGNTSPTINQLIGPKLICAQCASQSVHLRLTRTPNIT